MKKQDAFSTEMELGVFNDDMDQIHTLIRPIPSFLDTLSSRGKMSIPKTTNSDHNSVHPILQLPQKRIFRRAEKIKKSVEFSPIVESRHDSRIVLAKRPPAKDIKVDNEIRSLKETILFVNKKIDHVLEKIVSAPLPTPSENVKTLPSADNTVVKGQEPVQMAKDPPKGQKAPPTTPHSPQTTHSTSKQDAQPSNKENSLHQGTNIQTQSIQTNRRSAVKSQQTPRKLSTGQQTNKTQTTRHKEKSTQHKPHHTIEKSTQASNSKAGLMVKKLVGLLSRSSTKKSELVVIKPSEDVVSVDDFIPAKHKAKICKAIKKVDELVDNEKDVVVSNPLEQQGEDFETGEWFETPNGENKADATKDEEVHTPHTSKDNLPVKSHPSKTNLEKKVRSLCVLPTKQNCETNLEVFVDKESSRDLSEDFEAALENFKTKHGESLDKDFIKNNKIAEIIDEKFKSKSDVDNKTKLASIKNKLQDISIDTDIMNDESDILNIFQSSSDSVRVSSITKEKIKEDKTKTKVKKKVQHKGKKDTETEMALRILNSDEIERKHIETENTKNRTKDNH